MTTANLTWTLPTLRVPVEGQTEGDPLDPSDIANVDVFDNYQRPGEEPTGPVLYDTVPGAATSYATGLLAVGMHTFTVIVNDTSSRSPIAAPSNAVQLEVEASLGAPEAVSDLALTASEPPTSGGGGEEESPVIDNTLPDGEGPSTGTPPARPKR